MTKYVLVPLFLALLALPSWAQNSAIGHWVEDESGLPCYQYTGALPYQKGDAIDSSQADPFFLLGNYRLTLFTHVSGIYQMMTGERAWARLNQAGKSYGDNGAELTVRSSGNEKYPLVGLGSMAADEKKCTRVFGTGYARYDYELSENLACTRILSVKPSAKVNEGIPAVVEIVKIWNKGQKEMALSYSEWILANFCMAQEQGKPDALRPMTYRNKVVIDKNRSLIKADIFGQSKDPLLVDSQSRPSVYDGFPPSLFIQIPSNSDLSRIDLGSERIEEGKDRLRATIDISLKPDEEIEFRVITGLSYAREPEAILAQCLALKGSAEETSQQKAFNSEALFRAEWKSKLPKMTGETDPLLRQEMVWDAYILEAMATYSEFYGETFIPQGVSYDYDWGIQTAPRDHLQHSLPLNFFDPQLAKSCIRYALKKMSPDGEMKYYDSGYGVASSLPWTPSDQQLYLFMAVAEYLRVTGDADLLLEETNFLPMESGYKGTTLDKLALAFGYLRDQISTGPHGLVRLLNADWNESVYSDAPLFPSIWTAESHLNSAMALKVLPDLVSALTRLEANAKLAKQKDQIGRLKGSIKLYTDGLQKAYFADLGEKPFSSRLYFNQETPTGEDNLFLEPQPYLMQLANFTADRKFALLKEIQDRLIGDEILGARQREKAQKGPSAPGTRENGGFWYALNGPLTVAVSTFNKPAGWELLRKMTFGNFAAHHPESWIGQWSAPDCLNSTLAESPEQVVPQTMGTATAVYSAHAHAWPLYCYFRLREQVN